MKLELILSDEQVRLMRDELDNKSVEMHVLAMDYLKKYTEAKDLKLKSARLDDLDKAYRKYMIIEMIADMIHEQYEANKRKL